MFVNVETKRWLTEGVLPHPTVVDLICCFDYVKKVWGLDKCVLMACRLSNYSIICVLHAFDSFVIYLCSAKVAIGIVSVQIQKATLRRKVFLVRETGQIRREKSYTSFKRLFRLPKNIRLF